MIVGKRIKINFFDLYEIKIIASLNNIKNRNLISQKQPTVQERGQLAVDFL